MKIKILIVDDNKDTRDIIGHLADATSKGQPTEILYAANLAEAKKQTEEHDPHLTFLDLNLGDASIEETLAYISKCKPPVIIVSGYTPNQLMPSGKTLLAECYLAGAEDYIQKATDRFMQLQAEWMKVILRKYTGVENGKQTI